MGNDDGWIWFWGQEASEEHEECQKCSSEHTEFDDYREVWVCLECDYEWKSDGSY